MRSFKQVGLALGGGVVRGIAHIGVLEVLQAANVPVDCLSGTSVGSLVGALFCAGFDPLEIEHISAKMGWRDVSRPVLSPMGLLSFDKLETMLQKLLGDLDFDDLEIPFAVVTTDMATGRMVTLNQGKVIPAVRASCSVPGIVEPRRINGHWLADGGVVNNLPVSAVRGLGADYVIGIDIFEPFYARQWGPLGFGLTAIEMLISRAGGGENEADCLIRPALAGATFVRFSQREKLIESGRIATQKSLPGLQLALSH